MPKSKIFSSQQGFSHLVLLIAVFGIVGVGVMVGLKIPISSDSDTIDVKGVLVAKGGEDDSSDNGFEEADESGSSNSGSSGSSSGPSDLDDDDNDSASSSTSTSIKTTTSDGVRIKAKSSEEKEKTEIRFSEDEKIKIKTEEDRTRVDVYQEGVKVRYEWKDGRFTIKAETEDGEEVEDEELFKIEDRLEKSGIKVAAAGGGLLVARNNIGALANFPLQVDLTTNQLIASTSAGTKVLTVLPDQAVQNMLAANIISKLAPSTLVNEATTGAIKSVRDVVRLGERSGAPVYEIDGIREQKLLGFIPVSTPISVIVSAESGNVLEQQQSLLTRVIDLLSP